MDRVPETHRAFHRLAARDPALGTYATALPHPPLGKPHDPPTLHDPVIDRRRSTDSAYRRPSPNDPAEAQTARSP